MPEPMSVGASEAAVGRAIIAVRDRLGARLPLAYADFLRRHDGLDLDGVVFYAAAARDDFWQGLLEANEAWRDAPGNADLLILGEDDMSIYAVDLEGEHPTKRDRMKGEVVEGFVNADAMIEHALRNRLS